MVIHWNLLLLLSKRCIIGEAQKWRRNVLFKNVSQEYVFNYYKTTETQIFLSQKQYLLLDYLASCWCFDLKDVKTSKEDSG